MPIAGVISNSIGLLGRLKDIEYKHVRQPRLLAVMFNATLMKRNKIKKFYAHEIEANRLEQEIFKLEGIRTKEIIERTFKRMASKF